MAVSKKELDFNHNEDKMRSRINALEKELSIIKQGGGEKKIKKLHASGKLSAREKTYFWR